MIRRATAEDVSQIVAMGGEFLRTVYAGKIVPDSDAMARTATWLLQDDASRALFVSESGGELTGMIGLIVYPHLFSGELCASELFWWVQPSARGSLGVRLLRHAERWAKDVGAHLMQMIAPTEWVGQIYARLGFERVEVSWQRRWETAR